MRPSHSVYVVTKHDLISVGCAPCGWHRTLGTSLPFHYAEEVVTLHRDESVPVEKGSSS